MGSSIFPFGVGVELGKGFSLRPMYDGDRGHVMLNYFATQYGVSLMYVWLENHGYFVFSWILVWRINALL